MNREDGPVPAVTPSRRKKILFIGPLPPPIGGETVSTRKLVDSRYWDEAGAELDVVNLYGQRGFRLQQDPARPKDLFRGIRVFLQFLMRLRGSDQVLICITRRSLCSLGLAMIWVCRVAGKPVTVKVFGSYLISQITGYPRWRQRLTVRILSNVRRLLPQTAATAAGLAETLGLDAGLVTVFPNFLLDSVYDGPQAKSSFGGRCIYLGHIKEEKGVFDIVSALGSKKDVSCDFYGEMIPRYRERFLGEIAGHANLAYRGLIEPASVIPTLKDYDVLLLPTRHIGEGMPAVILEAFAAGVPVVATAWKSIPEIVEDGSNGLLVPVGEPSRIAGAVDRLASDAQLRASLASNGYRTALAYSEKAVVKELLIRDILGL